VVHVNDASRAVAVPPRCSRPTRRDGFLRDIRTEYDKITDAHYRAQRNKKRLTLEAARANHLKIDWQATRPVKPSFLGVRTFRSYPLAELVETIDWGPFFQAWELSGRFPAILDDPSVGEVARSLHDDARKMLETIVRENWFTANAVIGFWPANAVGDDVVLYTDETRTAPLATLHTLRQQLERRAGRANLALADFIAPKDSGVPDYIGAFVVTAGIGEEDITRRFKTSNDDYSSILVKALADRLAEAFAERMHQRVRKEFWGYAPDEALSNDDLILEKYQGIRPAPGYPAQPDHTEKRTIFRLLDAERKRRRDADREPAMWPGLPRCPGVYYSHPQSEYFGVAKVERDQVEDYARRKGASRRRRPSAGWPRSSNYIPTANSNAARPRTPMSPAIPPGCNARSTCSTARSRRRGG